MSLLRCLILLLLATPALGYQNPELERSADQYHERLLSGEPAANRIQTLRRAVRHAELGEWAAAGSALEALIAGGEDRTPIWLRLGESWRWRDDPDRARQATFNGWRAAGSDADRATALFQLGLLYQIDDQPRAALTAWEAALALRHDSEFAQRYQRLAESLVFRVEALEVNADGSQPRICLRFSAPLANRLDYADYLWIEPSLDAAVSTHDTQLCIDGASHGSDYRITVRAGLPAADGSRSITSETFVAAVGDRSAQVGFRGNAYVLPRQGSQELPLTTVNVDRVRLELLRINDRNLTEQLNSDTLHRVLDGYDSTRIAERSGELVWSGELDIAGELNREITTAVAMRQLLPETAPGIYIITAENAAAEPALWRDRATQWLVVSDLGISTLRGADGLHVFLRSLGEARPLVGVTLRLHARNNSLLGEGQSDAQGYLRFPPGLLRASGGREPAMLMAYGPTDDYSFLDLTRTAFDLGDRGVAGRPAAAGFDAYLYSDRGVYRPGEVVELMALLRDGRGHVTEQAPPLTLRVLRPDQVEVERRLLGDALLGGYHGTLELPVNARTGNWRVLAHLDPQSAPVGELSFQVEDFVPQQLRVHLDTEADALAPGSRVPLEIVGEYLYGAPAARLNSSAELVLHADPDPYPDYPGYRFGSAREEFTAQRQPLAVDATDASGRTTVWLEPVWQPDTSLPLRATVRVSLFEPGGRPVSRSLSLAYPTRPFVIGIKPPFGDSAARQEPLRFELLALSPDGRPYPVTGLRYELFREDHEYYWYFQNNRWDYRLIVRDSLLPATRSVDLGETASTLEQPGLDWGHYRVEVHDPNTGVASSVRFRVGWFVTPMGGDTPDQLRLSLDQPDYVGGATARVHIQAPFAGHVQLAVAGERLWQTHEIDLPAEGTVFELPVDPAWSPGVYLMATAFRPLDGSPGSARAVGVAWLGLERAERTLAVDIPDPGVVRPRQSLELPVRVGGVAAGQTAYLTVAAVDEGILQLTDYRSPNPLEWFLGQRRLGLDLLDLYGRLIETDGRPGTLRSGADADQRDLDASTLSSVESVALFSGPVAVDDDGLARIDLTLPDFNGELRLMAVAWDGYRYGRAEQALTVRDPLIAEVYRPRFLAPGDRAELLLSLHQLDAPPGDYTAQLSTRGALKLEDDTPLRVRFGGSDTLRQSYTLIGLEPGEGELLLHLSGPDGFALDRVWPITVRPAQTHSAEHRSLRLEPGESLRLDVALLSDYLPATARLRASVSSRPGINVPELLARLDRYPYGCLEQLTSRALPLVYFGPLAERWAATSVADTRQLRQQVQTAIQRILAMQRYDGSFALWHADGNAEIWLSAYVMDFLSRARAADYLVPGIPYQRGLDSLQQQLRDGSFGPSDLVARAYALYVLASTRGAPMGELRYLHDNHLDQLPTRLARAQLGAALVRQGDRERARIAFQAALEELDPTLPADGYGSPLRDLAGLVALAAESGMLDDQLPGLTEELALSTHARTHTSTQEQAWLLLAAGALSQDRDELLLSVNGDGIQNQDPYYLQSDPTELARGIELSNRGRTAAWVVLDTSGIPAQPQAPARTGFHISRRYYSRDGEPLAPDDIARNDLLVAVISGELTATTARQALVVDLLPAGFELENARLAHGIGVEELDWLPELSPVEYLEIRADRYVAALPGEFSGEFTLAYLVRAVTPGVYALPAVFVEDMYQPWHYGRGAMDRLTVR